MSHKISLKRKLNFKKKTEKKIFPKQSKRNGQVNTMNGVSRKDIKEVKSSQTMHQKDVKQNNNSIEQREKSVVYFQDQGAEVRIKLQKLVCNIMSNV